MYYDVQTIALDVILCVESKEHVFSCNMVQWWRKSVKNWTYYARNGEPTGNDDDENEFENGIRDYIEERNSKQQSSMQTNSNQLNVLPDGNICNTSISIQKVRQEISGRQEAQKPLLQKNNEIQLKLRKTNIFKKTPKNNNKKRQKTQRNSSKI